MDCALVSVEEIDEVRVLSATEKVPPILDRDSDTHFHTPPEQNFSRKNFLSLLLSRVQKMVEPKFFDISFKKIFTRRAR